MFEGGRLAEFGRHLLPPLSQFLEPILFIARSECGQYLSKVSFEYKLAGVILKSGLITRAGFEALKKEHDELWHVERPEVTKIVSWAASLGDRSENADYQYGKKRLREIDRRVRYIRKSLESLTVVDYRPEQEGRVFFGARVEVENDDGEVLNFRIVGYDEIFNRKDYISIDSPMARALLKHEVGDDVVVKTEASTTTWYVNSIHYEK